MRAFSADVRGALIVHLEPGEDLYHGLLEACRIRGVRDAVVVDGHATLDPAVIHDVTSTGYPIDENVREIAGPLELTAIQGLVIDGEIHAHVTIANSEAAHGGHLHEGTRVLYLAEVTLLVLEPERRLERFHEEGTHRWLIREAG